MTRLDRVTLSPLRRRRALQLIFVFANLALVEAHLPGLLWLAVGGFFWAMLVLVSVSGSGLVCGSMCWIGAIQDFAEPLARPRVHVDPRLGRSLTLGLLVSWIPVGWLLLPAVLLHQRTPIDLDLGSWQGHVFQIVLALAIAASVTVLGKRGLCHSFCPFNTVVAAVRGAFYRGQAVSAPVIACARQSARCHGCAVDAVSSSNRLTKVGSE
ncbi:MAG: 4Fe-4S binding protein [Candidatus Baltobacteraceae bacterium]|jgi:polyferredoxin